MENKKEEYIGTKCYSCEQRLKVLLTAKCYTCPHCGDHYEFDARHFYEQCKHIL